MNPAQYKAQPLWGILASIRDAYAKVATPPEPYRTQLKGVGEFIEFVGQFEPSDDYTGILATDSGVSNLHSWLTNLLSHLEAVGKDQWGSIENAYNQAVSWMPHILQNFGALPANQSNPAAKRVYTQETNRLVGEAQEARRALAEATATHQAEVAELHKQLEAVAERVTTAEARFATAEAQAKTALNDQIDSQRATFVEEAAAREKSFETERKERRTAAESAFEEFLAKAATERDGHAARAKQILETLAGYEERSEALIDSTSRNAIAGSYGGWADVQGKQAFRWTIATVVASIATAITLVFLLVVVKADEASDTAYLVFKTGIGIVMLAVAGYCASQAAQHRHEERTAKRLHLDLAALEPFLKQVKDPEQLRTDIANRVFAPGPPEASRQSPFIQFGRGFSLDQVLNFVNAIRDKGGPAGPVA